MKKLLLGSALALSSVAGTAFADGHSVSACLITKTDTNPFFVKMKEGAESKAEELGMKPRARFHAFAVTGTDPVTMLKGPIPATEKVLARSGLSIDDIDLFEVNEAFASVVLAWQNEHNTDLSKTNVNGGAIALGHPLGCSGAKLMTTLINELERTGGRYGLQTMCEGGGLANATIIERL